MNAGPKELNEDFIRSLPDNGPVVMVNLLRFKRGVGGWRRLRVGCLLAIQQGDFTAPKGGRRNDPLGWRRRGRADGDLNAKHWEFVVRSAIFLGRLF